MPHVPERHLGRLDNHEVADNGLCIIVQCIPSVMKGHARVVVKACFHCIGFVTPCLFRSGRVDVPNGEIRGWFPFVKQYDDLMSRTGGAPAEEMA